ncbi:hypothetical protein FACS1894132_03620 [Clostridia bacterium]|nr:hypothetical protein FACS1894132_03620 [Clostridia bacterium]
MFESVLGEKMSAESKIASVLEVIGVDIDANQLTEEENKVEVKDYIKPSEIIFTALETAIVAKQLAIDTAKTAKKVVGKTKENLVDFKDYVISSEIYRKLGFLSEDLKEYFQIRKHSISYCHEQLQLCLYECSRISGLNLTSKHILKQAKLSERKRLREILVQNKKDFWIKTFSPVSTRTETKSETYVKPLGLYPKNKRAALTAFLLVTGQYTLSCLEQTKDDMILFKKKLQRNILNTAMHIGTMSIVGVYGGQKLAVNTAKSTVENVAFANSAVRNKIVGFVGTKQEHINKNLTAKKDALRLIGRKISKSRRLGLKSFLYSLLTGSKATYSVFSGMLKTTFNYAAPALAITLLIGLVTDYANKEYGIALEMGNQQIAVLQNEAEYDKAEQLVIDRAGLSASLPEDPKYALKIVNDKGEYTDTEQLAAKLLSATSNELTDAYSIKIDGEVIGTVSDPKPIVNALESRLLSFSNNGNVENIVFGKNIEYVPIEKGEISLNDTNAVIERLLGYEEIDSVYTTAKGDELYLIAKSLGTTEVDFRENNPDYDFSNIKAGDKLIYTRKDYFLPVVYTKTLRSTSSISYMTLTVDTDSLYKGNTSVLQEGQIGEQSEIYNVTYTNGVEVERTLIKSEILKSAQTEIIGVGTFVSTPLPANLTPGSYAPSEQLLADNGKYIWPVNGGYISATMGDGRGHKGIDIAAPRGTEIYAVEAGTVILAKNTGNGYGNYVVIDHGDGFQTLYGHMSEIVATLGQEVQTGECIGLVGSTGDSSGNHLHIEVHYQGAYLNPLDFISKR